MSSFDDLFSQVEVPPEHPHFYSRVVAYLLPRNGKAGLASEEYDDITRRLDRTEIQESTSVRNVLKTRAIATLLIADDGELKLELLDQFVADFEKQLYSLAPGREHDAVRDTHILQVLRLLKSNKKLAQILRHMTRPLSNRLAEQIIRDTLLLPGSVTVTDVHVRRAALSAWLCYLRQSLGSCFATAPAILVQKEQPELFLSDLDEMMNTGSMKRTYAGSENRVPMSTTWGNGDLRKPFILERDLGRNEHRVWASPGLIAALDAAGLFTEEMSYEKKAHDIRKRLETSIGLLEKQGEAFYTNAEELIKSLLLQRYGLTLRQVDDHINRPKNILQGGILLHVPITSKFSKGKEDPVPAYLRDLEVAKTAFKSLADNALLKSWEFTLASFAEVNLDFCRGNLYTSLGINHDDVGGVGHCLYRIVSLKVDHANAELQELQKEYDEILVQVHYLEGRARVASTEKEINWVKMEYQSRQTELYHIDQLRQMANERAMKIASLHEFLMRQYDALFPTYFQEVYDAEIHDVAQGPFDDSPAGFRLIYKYGRANPSLWTKITSLSEFIEALVSFFTITEVDISSMPQMKGVEQELSLIITQLVSHVRSDEFMESALFRMAKTYGTGIVEKPLENLDKVEKKPWVYTSGGSMSTLVGAYFRREGKPTAVNRWVENETELLAFFIDTMKQLPANTSDLYLQDPSRSMLMHSPTHAFLLKPGLFKEAWTSELYTYSWIKHSFVEPALDLVEPLYLDEDMGHHFIQELLPKVPPNFRPRYNEVFRQLPYQLRAEEFRSYVVNAFFTDRGLKTFHGPVVSPDTIDSLLYQELPYLPKEKLRSTLQELLQNLSPKDIDFNFLDEMLRKLSTKGAVSAKQLVELAKVSFVLALGKTRLSQDLHKKIIGHLRKKNLLLPAPLIFADSNWIKDYFAFVVSPTTKELELWSVDFYGLSGKPISYWKVWVNGSRREPQWGIYSKPHEYVR